MTGDMISRQAAIDAIIEDKICDDSWLFGGDSG